MLLAESGTIVDSVLSGATTVASQLSGLVASLAPIAFGVVAAVLVVKKGIGIVKGLLGKAS